MKTRTILKKSMAVILAFAMLAPIMGHLEANVKEVQAEETSTNDSLNVKCQVTQGVVTQTDIEKYQGKYVMRFVSAVKDYKDYKEIGFKLLEEGETEPKTAKVKTVFKRIESTTGSTATEKEEYTYGPKVIDTDGEYFITAKNPIEPEKNAIKFTVWAYGIKLDGTEVAGPERCVSVNDGLEECTTINMSFPNTGNVELDGVTKLKANDLDAEVIGLSQDKATVHVRITPTSELKSATLFELKTEDGTVIGKEIFRNLNTEYTGVDTEDTSWFDEYEAEGETKFIIATSADLYGFASIVNDDKTSTEHKFYMVSDIATNNAKKDGTEAKTWQESNTEPTYSWVPIEEFNAEFDGQGFAISGLYGDEADTSTTYGIGLFSITMQSAKIHDVSLMNSYFQSSKTYGMAGIASQGRGTFKNIHTNVILRNAGNTESAIDMGGIVGKAMGKLTIDNCWSAADISGEGRYAGGILGRANKQQVSIEHCMNSGTLYRFGETACNNKYSDYGGIVGSAATDKTNVTTINDCLNVGIVKSDRTSSGNDVGHISGEGPGSGYGDKLIITNCYGVQGNCFNNRNSAITILNVCVGASASYTTPTDSQILSADDLKGLNAFNNSTLDFKTEGNYWVLQGDGENASSDQYPILKAFAAPNETDYLYGEIKYATDWYVEGVGGTITDKWDLYGLTKIEETGTEIEITLGKDIVVNALADGTDVSTWRENAPEYTWTPIYKLAGKLNGAGYGIYGLYYNSSATDNNAFIRTTTVDAKIENITFDNCCFIGKNNLSVVAGKGAGTFDKVHIGKNAKLYATGQRIGGFLGNAEDTLTISNSWFEGYIEATNPTDDDQAKNVGGFVGQLNTESKTYTIKHSLSAGTVKRINGKNANGGIGGFVGKANKGTLVIDDCLHHGTVNSDKKNDQVGLIIGCAGSNAELTYTSTYSDKNANSTAIVIINGTNLTSVNDTDPSFVVDSSEIKGTSIDITKITLNFDTKWMMQEDNYPVLNDFQ